MEILYNKKKKFYSLSPKIKTLQPNEPKLSQ